MVMANREWLSDAVLARQLGELEKRNALLANQLEDMRDRLYVQRVIHRRERWAYFVAGGVLIGWIVASVLVYLLGS